MLVKVLTLSDSLECFLMVAGLLAVPVLSCLATYCLALHLSCLASYCLALRLTVSSCILHCTCLTFSGMEGTRGTRKQGCAYFSGLSVNITVSPVQLSARWEDMRPRETVCWWSKCLSLSGIWNISVWNSHPWLKRRTVVSPQRWRTTTIRSSVVSRQRWQTRNHSIWILWTGTKTGWCVGG